MPKTATVQKKALTALATWLTQRFAATLTASDAPISVSDDWPEPSVPLVNRRVTVLLAGPPDDETFAPELVGKVSNATQTTPAVYRWRTACRRQNIQIDSWATTEPDIHDVSARLEAELRRGTLLTLNDPTADPVSNTLVLDLSAQGVSSIAQFSFEGPEFELTSNQVQQQEYRSTILGTVDVTLTVDAPSVAIAMLRLREYAMPKPDHGTRVVATVTATTESITEEQY